MPTSDWPVLDTYEGARRHAVRMPLGGLGSGSISITGRGQLVDFATSNEPAHGFTPARAFFALRYATAGADPVTRILEGELFDHEYEGAHGSPVPQHGLPRFRHCSFDAAFPFGQLRLEDPSIPAGVLVRVVNPLVPQDADGSGYPAFLYRVVIKNTAASVADVTVVGSLPNYLGGANGQDAWKGNTFTLQQHDHGSTLLGTTARTDPHPRNGTIALHSPRARASSTRTNWADRPWGDALAEFWNDLHSDGALADHPQHTRGATGSLALTERIEPGRTVSFDFVVAWHSPYRRAWVHHVYGTPLETSDEIVGNHYTTRFADAADAAVQFGAQMGDLIDRTHDFVTDVAARVPQPLAEAALANLAVLKSPTVFRTHDGRFYGWEGCEPDRGSCHGSCTHVWNYEYATTDLFGELAWSMRRTELVDSLDDRGAMMFRAGLPSDSPEQRLGWGYAAADGQMGSILRLYRTWQRTGEHNRLRELWPYARRALAFAWIPGGWDADADGVMEGCQHNTMDIEYYGPTPEIQSWYLGALAASAEMAHAEGDLQFAARCQDLLTRGCAWMDEHLFNGHYYQQLIIPAADEDDIAPGLRMKGLGEGGAVDLSQPDYQIGSGCTSDQLAGVTMAQLCGLRIPLDREHVRAALHSIAMHNHRSDFHDHVNPMRSYAVGDESGLLNASFPTGRELEYPFPYWSEVWPGFEYTAALGLLGIGEEQLALRTVRETRARHDGRRRNPFDEVECGHHYVRSMASWGLLEAWEQRQTTVPAATRPGAGEAFESLDGAIRAGVGSMRIEANAIMLAADRVAPQLRAAVRLIRSASGRVLISGIGKSGHIGAKIAATLASTGTPAQFVHSSEALHGDSGMTTPSDVAVLISNSGETAEVNQFARMLRRWCVPMIAMTRDPGSSLAQLCDVHLDISVDREADPLGLAPTTSTTVTIAIGDALAAVLMTMSGFTREQFAERHPGGSLGAQIGAQS